MAPICRRYRSLAAAAMTLGLIILVEMLFHWRAGEEPMERSDWCSTAGLADARQRNEDLLDLLHLEHVRDLQSYANQRTLEIGLTIADGAEMILLADPITGSAALGLSYVPETAMSFPF